MQRQACRLGHAWATGGGVDEAKGWKQGSKEGQKRATRTEAPGLCASGRTDGAARRQWQAAGMRWTAGLVLAAVGGGGGGGGGGGRVESSNGEPAASSSGAVQASQASSCALRARADFRSRRM